MEENLTDALIKTADVLHWLGKFHESNACILLSRLLRARRVDSLNELEALVSEEEAKAFEASR